LFGEQKMPPASAYICTANQLGRFLGIFAVAVVSVSAQHDSFYLLSCQLIYNNQQLSVHTMTEFSVSSVEEMGLVLVTAVEIS